MKEKRDMDELQEYVLRYIDTYLPEAYKGKVGCEIVTKTNDVKLHGIFFELPENIKENTYVRPTLYLEGMNPNASYERICKEVAMALLEAEEKKTNFALPTKETLLNGSRLFLANRQKNRLDLSYEFEDLLVGIRCHMKIQGQNSAFIVTKNTIRALGISEKEIFEAAMKNTGKAAMIYDVENIEFNLLCGFPALWNLVNFMEVPAEKAVSILKNPPDMESLPHLLAVTDANNYFSAASILCREVQEKISELFEGKDYYILPASVHECLVTEADMDVVSVREIVFSVNKTEVSNEDFLSDSVYRYTKGKGIYLV